MNLPRPFQRIAVPNWLLVGAVTLGLIVGAIALGAAFGKGSVGPIVLILGLPAAVLGAAALIRYFPTFVLLIPLTALTLPLLEAPTGTDSKLPASLLLTIALSSIWIISMLIRRWRLRPSRINTPSLVFGLVCIVSLVWSILWRDFGTIAWSQFPIIQVGALVTILASLCAALLIGNFVTSKRQLKYIIALFLVFCSLMIITQTAGINQRLLNDRGLWGTWLIACSYGLLIAQPGLRWYWRGLLLLVTLVAFYHTMVVNSFWVSGWLPSIAAVVAITFLRSWKAGLLILVAGTVGFMLTRGFFNDVAQDNIDDGSLERLIIYGQSWRILKDHLLLGTGPAGYAIYYMTYFPTEARSTHNNYLDIAGQFGIIGSCAWIWLSLAVVWEGAKLSWGAPDGILRATAIISTGGWIGAMVSMVLGDWVLPFAYNQGIVGFKYTVYSWIFVGTLIAVRHLATQSDGPGDGQGHANA